jgi:hypothetical protein
MFPCRFQAKYKQIITEAHSSTTRGITHALKSLSLLLNIIILPPKLTDTRLENVVIAKYVIDQRQVMSIIMLCFSGLTLMMPLILNCLALNVYSRLEQ